MQISRRTVLRGAAGALGAGAALPVAARPAAAAAAGPRAPQASTRRLASLGRELAANDPQDRTDGRRHSVEDRDVELLVAGAAALQRRGEDPRP